MKTERIPARRFAMFLMMLVGIIAFSAMSAQAANTRDANKVGDSIITDRSTGLTFPTIQHCGSNTTNAWTCNNYK